MAIPTQADPVTGLRYLLLADISGYTAFLNGVEQAHGVDFSAGLPAHVGLHAGPVLFQEGDYFGRTVNIASRIAAYARPGEVLVSQEVVDAAKPAGVAFAEIGPVDLKGVAGSLRVFTARRTLDVPPDVDQTS